MDSVICPYCSRYHPQRRDEDQTTTTCPALAGRHCSSLVKLHWSWRNILGWWDLGLWIGWVCFFFPFMIFALGLTQIVVLDEQRLMPPPISVPTSSTALHAFVVPSISPLSRFADLSLHSPAINSLVSNFPAVRQHLPRETSSLALESVMAYVQANDKPSSVSPTPSSEPEPARMEMDEQTTPDSPVGLDPLDEPPPPTTTDSEDISMVTSSPSFVVPPADIVYFDCFGSIIEFGCSNRTTPDSCFNSKSAAAAITTGSSSRGCDSTTSTTSSRSCDTGMSSSFGLAQR